MDSQPLNFDTQQAHDGAIRTQSGTSPLKNLRDVQWLIDKPTGRSSKASIPNWAWALLCSSLAVSVAMGWMAWRYNQSLGVEKRLTKAITTERNRVASGVVIMPSNMVSMLPKLDPSVLEQIEKAQAGIHSESASADKTLASTNMLSNDDWSKLSTDELLARTQQIVAGHSPKVSTDVSVSNQEKSQHFLDTPTGLPLKISVSMRMTPILSSQP